MKYALFAYRFNIKWIKKVTLQTYENIDSDPQLSELEKKYLKGLHKRTNKKLRLPERPSINDYRRLALAYGKATRVYDS